MHANESTRLYLGESFAGGVSRRLGVQPPKNARVCLSYVKSQEDASQHSTVLVERKRRNSFGNYLAGPRTLMSDLEQPAHESADSIETLEEEDITVEKRNWRQRLIAGKQNSQWISRRNQKTRINLVTHFTQKKTKKRDPAAPLTP